MVSCIDDHGLILLYHTTGKDDLAKVAAVKDIYKQINLPKIFKEYEEQSYENIQSLINEVEGMPRNVFSILLAKIYKRCK